MSVPPEPNDPFARYPSIAALRHSSRKGRGSLDDDVEYGAMYLPQLEAALSRLEMTSRPSLRGLVDDLFSNDVARLLAAVTEILSFDWLKQKGLLVEGDIGFPADWTGGDDPPFEGALRIADRLMPFDVKDGSGAALNLLSSLFEKKLSVEAGRRQVAPPEVHVALDAPAGQKWVEKNFAALMRPFRDDVAAHGLQPRLIKLPAGSGFVKVGLAHRAGASVIGLEEKAAFVSEQIFKHASEKAQKLQKLTSTTVAEFMLIYLKRPGTGHADFDRHTMETACGFLAARSDLPAPFAGLVFLEMDGSEGETTALWDRHAALPKELHALVTTTLNVAPKAALEDRRARAARVPPASLMATTALMAGSCDLRGADCSARGSIGPVFEYFAGEEQLLACQNCRQAFGWPPPSVT